MLGEFYSTYSEQFIPGFSLWDQEIIEHNKKIILIPSEKVEFEAGETLSDAEQHFDLTAGVRASILAGLVVVEGSAKYIETKKVRIL